MDKNKTYDLSIIKDKYGEEFAKLCNELFPSILKDKGRLSSLLISKFASNRNLYNDIIDSNQKEIFKDYVYSYFTEEKDYYDSGKSVKELLAYAGYDFYECHNEEDIQQFRKYYKEGEGLCTFHGGRLGNKLVFWIIKKNALGIKRENFTNPQREDEYGTSVMSIQFTRGFINSTEIINRYNNGVLIGNEITNEKYDPNNTYNGDLEQIIEGLTKAFEKEYDLNINRRNNKIDNNTIRNKFVLPNYVLANDGKFYRYNYEINGIYFCSKDEKNKKNIIIKNGSIVQLDPERYIMLDCFILDLKEKTLKPYKNEDIKTIEKDIDMDPFINRFKDIKKVDIRVNKENKHKIVKIILENNDEIFIELNKEGKMIKIIDNYIKEIPDYYLIYNNDLEYFECKNATKIGDLVLNYNRKMKMVNIPKVKIIGSFFLFINETAKIINAKNVEIIGHNCLANNRELLVANFPELIEVGISFLSLNEKLIVLNCPKIRETAHCFVNSAKSLKVIVCPYLPSKDFNIIKGNNKNSTIITRVKKIKRK